MKNACSHGNDSPLDCAAPDCIAQAPCETCGAPAAAVLYVRHYDGADDAVGTDFAAGFCASCYAAHVSADRALIVVH